MTKPFDYFVVFAEMRTGSNFLEANLNVFPTISCVGEAFNPHFIGYPDREECLGISEEERNRDPMALIHTVKHAQGIAGFRFFHDHDPRVLEEIISNPRCGKIILTRNPVDSYVSWKIAQATGQWKLTNVANRKDARATFDAREFKAHLDALQEFQIMLMRELQVRGQTAFYVAYEDLQDVGVMNGIATWLGQPDRLEGLDRNLKRQNPEPLSKKVANFEEMEAALAGLDRFNLTRTPNFEPRRGAAVPNYVASAKTPLMYLPVRSGPEDEVRAWMQALDGAELQGDFSQKSLRQWMRGNKGHRSFTVLRHPVARAHHAFCTKILTTGPGSYNGIRKTLRRVHQMPIPESEPDESWNLADHRAAFLSFLDFVRANLSGQSAVRQDAHWASQAAVLQGMGSFALPDLVLREDEMAAALPALARRMGHAEAPSVGQAGAEAPYALGEVYDDSVEQAAQETYARDYLVFGFGAWAG
ncbi:sulfotransferase family 2 domain-containing protein [Alisedimentitalea sp. MJ-SS2]|uniref:sulfotransferase family 2 domain-containing protein n=1 Tax=Aliisedimentitalea sp. MJ-SS2 TaxID=3049795 RepID=UPI00290DA25A|nr:sulfotransferase family 2 domain-containing protein [Alisedimentitalea sp. MJ-SS2]MDU8927847.1 sulfotransferase family 2 domain-containing protein [Alisedimentitalea sp. MJ-SS2]